LLYNFYVLYSHFAPLDPPSFPTRRSSDLIEWINESGGLAWAAERTRTSSGLVYDWADAAEAARPYVVEPADRSSVVATIDFDESIDAAAVASALRDNGVVDVEPYRKLGRNQLRIATFVSVDP